MRGNTGVAVDLAGNWREGRVMLPARGPQVRMLQDQKTTVSPEPSLISSASLPNSSLPSRRLSHCPPS